MTANAGIWPGATWDGPLPDSNWSSAVPVAPKIGLQVHHADGSLASARATFHTAGAGRSSHYGIDFDGSALCWVDPRAVAYAGCNANWTGYLSAECASNPDRPDDPPTPQQIRTLADIAVWHGLAPRAVGYMGGPGIGYHRQFPGDCSTHWGQTDCPGDGFVAAIPAIVAAMTPLPPPTKGARVDLFTTKDGDAVTYYREAAGLQVALKPEEAAVFYPHLGDGSVAVFNLATAPAGAPLPAFLAALAWNAATVAALKANGVIPK